MVDGSPIGTGKKAAWHIHLRCFAAILNVRVGREEVRVSYRLIHLDQSGVNLISYEELILY